MFTGIVEETGKVRSFVNGELKVTCNKVLEDSRVGDSIAVNGVCLTITKIESGVLTFHVSDTTGGISRFKPGGVNSGEIVNMERAMQLRDRLGGHIVSGHIDFSTKIVSIQQNGPDHRFEFLYGKEYRKLIIPKGSVTVDGISLTISSVLSSSFIVTVIPQTYNETNLKHKRVGTEVHIEVDMFARYINHIIEFNNK